MSIVFLLIVTYNLILFWQLARQTNRALSEDSGGTTTSLEDAFAAILILIVIISWFSLILAEAGYFSLLPLSVALIAVGAAGTVWMKYRNYPLSLSLRIDRYDLLAVVAAILVALLYFRPHEWIPGGVDPGSYINIGINIGRTGSILIHEQAFTEIPNEFRKLFLYSLSGNPAYVGTHFPAFYVRSLESGLIEPQFFHVFPVWIALLYKLGGIDTALLTTPLFGWLAVVALYFLGRRLIHPAAGLFAMLLLALNISQLWFARTPFADIVLQFFLLSGFWALALLADRIEQSESAAILPALLGGACLGIAHLVKLDVIIIIPVIIGFFVLLWVVDRFRRPHTYALALYIALLFHSAIHSYLFSWSYVTDVFNKILSANVVWLAAGGAAIGALVLLFIAWQRQRLANLVHLLTSKKGLAGRTFVALITLASVYAYFIRPFQANLGALSASELASRGDILKLLHPLAIEPKMIDFAPDTRTFIEEGIVRVGWYLTPIGIWLSIAGFLHWTTQRMKVRSLPFLGATFLAAVLFFYRGALVPYFFWAFKRYVPLIIPAFILFMAYLLYEWWPKTKNHWQQGIPSLVLGVFLLISYTGSSLAFWGHQQYEGAREDIEQIHSSLPENAVLLFKRSDIANRAGLPLTYIYGRDVFEVREKNVNTTDLRQAVSHWHNRGRPVYWLTPKCEPTIWSYGPLEKVGQFEFDWPEVPTTLKSLPETIGFFSSDLCIYQIESTELVIPRNADANFGNKIQLLGYELADTNVSPNEELQLTLFWRAQQNLSTDYTVFTHVVDDELTIWGQKDTQPALPTSQWRTEAFIRDTISIPIKPETEPGTYQLRTGLYNLATLQRLPILDDSGTTISNHITLETIGVEEKENN